MGVFKEHEIERICFEENDAMMGQLGTGGPANGQAVNFAVAQMFHRLRQSQEHLRAARRREQREQMNLFKDRYKQSS